MMAHDEDSGDIPEVAVNDFRFAEQIPPPNSKHLTPGITRPLEPLDEHDGCRVAGRVHAAVRWRPHTGKLLTIRSAHHFGFATDDALR